MSVNQTKKTNIRLKTCNRYWLSKEGMMQFYHAGCLSGITSNTKPQSHKWTLSQRHLHFALIPMYSIIVAKWIKPMRWIQSQTFAQPIRVSLQLTVFHARNDVKERENLLLGKCGPCWHHQAPCEVPRAVPQAVPRAVPRAVVHIDRVVARVSCRGTRDTRVNNGTDATAVSDSQMYLH